MIVKLAGAAGMRYAKLTPTQIAAVAYAADSQNAIHGWAVNRAAAAAGAASSPSTVRAPTIWVASATVAPTRARKTAPSHRAGTPAACATAGSTVANSSGRAITISTTPTPAATATAITVALSLMPKMLPNNTLTFAVPLRPLPWVV